MFLDPIEAVYFVLFYIHILLRKHIFLYSLFVILPNKNYDSIFNLFLPETGFFCSSVQITWRAVDWSAGRLAASPRMSLD